MNEIIRTDRLKKEYYTITVGIPPRGRFTGLVGARRKSQQGQHTRPPRPGRPPQADRHRRGRAAHRAGRTLCAGSAWSPGAPIRSGPTWPTWAGPYWGTSNTATAKPTSVPAPAPRRCARVRISFLDIPKENTLHYLTGKVIKLKDPQILGQFDALDHSKQPD